MKRARLEQSSLFYYVKDGILARDWSVDVVGEPLVFDTRTNVDKIVKTHYRIVDPENSSYSTLPVENGRGWLYFEPKQAKSCTVVDPTTGNYITPPPQLRGDTSFTIPQKQEESLVVVRDENGLIIPREQFDIDYKNGRIRHYDVGYAPSGKVATSGTPTTVEYKFHFVGTLDGWPSDNNPPPSLPFVAIYPDMRENEPLQVGPGVTFVRSYIIDVFAQNSGQRTDLLDTLYQGLYEKHSPVIDFNRTGGPLRHNGTFNPDFLQTFSANGQSYQTYLTLNPGNGHTLYFINLEVTNNITPRLSRAEIERFRGRIVLTTETHSDRGIDAVGNVGSSPEPIGGFDSLRTESYSS